jgi:hypothetical protein
VRSLPPVQWWCRTRQSSEAVQGYARCVSLGDFSRFTLLCFFRIYLIVTGRWPEKSVKFLLRLLKNAESNADAKNLDLEDLFVRNIVVQQAPVRHSSLVFNLLTKSRMALRKPAAVLTVRTVVSTRTRATLATLKFVFRFKIGHVIINAPLPLDHPFCRGF